MHAADSVAINRLQVKGDKRSSQALVRELEQSSWPLLPLPAHLQHAWVLVREITVTGRARDLRQHTAKQLDGELQSAVRALRGNVGNANAIWFASLPELIAFLIALHQAGSHRTLAVRALRISARYFPSAANTTAVGQGVGTLE